MKTLLVLGGALLLLAGLVVGALVFFAHMMADR